MNKRDNSELTFGKLNVDSDVDISTMNRIMIPVRPIRCRKCNAEFKSHEVTCYDFSPERAIVHCPVCGAQNKIRKERIL